MAFSGVSRTITDTVSSEKVSTSAFDVSAEDWNRVISEVDEFYTNVMLENLPTRRCFAIDVLNGVPVQPMRLKSKETKSKLLKLSARARGLIYIQHSIIYLLYIPTILETTDGFLTIKLLNTNTGESIDVDTDSPLNEAAIFVARWPRSIHSDDGDGIHLLINGVSTNAKHGAKVGTFYPFWDDSLHRKKLYEKQYPTLRFPITKTDAASAADDVKILQSLAKTRVSSICAKKKDIDPTIIDIKAEAGKTSKTVDFKNLKFESLKDKVPSTSASSSSAITSTREADTVSRKEGVATS